MKSFFANPTVKSILLYFVMMGAILCIAFLLQPVLVPLIVSFVLYALLEPVTVKLEGRGFSQSAAVAAVLLGIIAFTVVCVVLIFPLILEQLEQIQERLPAIAQEISSKTDKAITLLNTKFGMEIDIKELGGKGSSSLQESAATLFVSSATVIFKAGITLILVPLITFFLLRDFRNVRNQVMSWLPNNSFELGWLIYSRVGVQLQKYIRGVIIQSVIVAIVTSIGFWALDLDMAVLFGGLAGLLNLIPYVGPLLAMVMPTLMVIGSGSIDMWMIAGVVGVILTAQIIDNVIVIPAVISSSVDLHPLTVLLGVFVFGYFFGFVGMLVAIPLMATSKIILTGLIFGLEGRISDDWEQSLSVETSG